MPNKTVNYFRLGTFFLIAVVGSNIFRFNVFKTTELIQKLPPWQFVTATALLEGCGVLIAALIALYQLRKERKITISFFGTSYIKSLMMAIIPIALLTIIGVKNNYGMTNYLYGFVAVFFGLIYCIMEEFGWRGYLEEEFKYINPYKKYVLIGFLWYMWHLSFLTDATFLNNMLFLMLMILSSWGIGQVITLTKSILASACFHLIIQIMMFNSLIKNGLSSSQKLIIFGITVLIYIAILQAWKKQDAIASSKNA